MFNRKDETSLASLVGDGKAQSLIRILYGCVSFNRDKEDECVRVSVCLRHKIVHLN